ncbi:serine/threonine-protein kinase D6PKL2-like protein [Tanacetum coccineum]
MAGGGIPTGPGNKAYPGNLTLCVTFTCVVAAMGGLIFGYDIGISGGVTSMDPFLKKFFPSVFRKQSEDTSTNQYCKFDTPWKLGLEAKSRGRSGPRLDYHGGVPDPPRNPNSMIKRGKQDEAKTSDSSTFVGQVKEVKVKEPVVNGSKAKSVTKESFKLRQKGSLQSTPSSSFISSNKLGKSINLVKTVIRNKNIVKKKSKQDLPAATSVIENVTFVPDTCQLVCERCHYALKELNPPPCTRISTECKSDFTQVQIDKRMCEYSSSPSISEESSRCSIANRPHMSMDSRRQAIHDMMKRNSGFLGLRHFNLLNKMRCGDTGIMYLAELVGTNLRYAIKVMDNEFLEGRKKMARAHTEREILRILDHPFLPTLYAHFVSDNLSCLVMDYCPGGDLHVLRHELGFFGVLVGTRGRTPCFWGH